jgi:hypothetical protein
MTDHQKNVARWALAVPFVWALTRCAAWAGPLVLGSAKPPAQNRPVGTQDRVKQHDPVQAYGNADGTTATRANLTEQDLREARVRPPLLTPEDIKNARVRTALLTPEDMRDAVWRYANSGGAGQSGLILNSRTENRRR